MHLYTGSNLVINIGLRGVLTSWKNDNMDCMSINMLIVIYLFLLFSYIIIQTWPFSSNT